MHTVTDSQFSPLRRFISAICTAAIVAAMVVALPATPLSAGKTTPASGNRGKAIPTIGQGSSGLPQAVAEMRDAIIAAARAGSLEELLIPIQWNELPPDFGDHSVKDTLANWKKQSPDGSGHEWLALLINLLESPYAVVRQGRDVENSKIYIWPAFAELPLEKLPPNLNVELHRIVSAREAARMRQNGYDGYALAIGADGTWHAFKKRLAPKKPVK
jgi:hypothetical protein